MGDNRQNAERRVAAIGGGYWGKNIIRNLHGLGALAVICDSDPDRRVAMTEQYPGVTVVASVEEVWADATIDAVMIATPAETHGDLVRAGLEAGKDVFVEKPLCLSSTVGRELVDLAAAKNRLLMVGHLLWYHSAVLELKRMIDAGELGRIQYIYSNRLSLGKIRREENILWSFAPHDVSIILGLIGEMPDFVEAQGGNYLHEQIADVTMSLFRFPSGVRSHVFVSWLHPFKEQKLVIVGDRQMAVFNDVEPIEKLVVYPHEIEWQGTVPVPNKAEAKVIKLPPGEPLRDECQHFIDCVATRATPRTDGEEGLRVLQVLERCEEALGATPKAGSSKPGYFAHSSAFIDDGVVIGAGSKIWHVSHVMKGSKLGEECSVGQNVVIGPNVVVGRGVKIQNNVSVYEGVTLEDFVFCGPSMVFTNVINPRSEIRRMHEIRPTLVRTGASLGANCTIVCGSTVGRFAFVGAGAVVTHDVPDHALVTGVPARVTGWMCRCGLKLVMDDAAASCECGNRYLLLGESLSLVGG